MQAGRYRIRALIPAMLLLAGCAAPYLHPHAVLGISTAELADSDIDQEAVLITVHIPLWQNPAPIADDEAFAPEAEPGSPETAGE